jgi:hypothetical protein
MNKSELIARLFAFSLAATILAIPANSQTTSSSPMVVKQDYPKRVWLKAEVIHADANSMIVRERANERMLHTFTYSPGIQDAMQKIMDAGGYQSGDKVKILYLQGQTVALKVHGKFSKPRTQPAPPSGTSPIPRPRPA